MATEELNIREKVNIIDFELSEDSNITNVIRVSKFDEIYNLAAQSFVEVSIKLHL